MNTDLDFAEYIREAESIFDIMATAYKMMTSFEARDRGYSDSFLKGAIIRFIETDDEINKLNILKTELIEWIGNQTNVSAAEMKGKFYFLIRLIDQRCVKCADSALPDSYINYHALNRAAFSSEISILPRFKSEAMENLSRQISAKEGRAGKAGFYGRNYARTADISGNLHNFVIWNKLGRKVAPNLYIPRYAEEMIEDFEQKGNEFKVGIFPLSNKNLEQMFELQKISAEDSENALFSIAGAVNEEEELVLARCKQALLRCQSNHVDLAVFPEMLFTERIQEELRMFVRSYGNLEEEMPWFIWLGTAWKDRKNQCCVIDRYGNIVFRQKKFVPYEWREISVNDKGEHVKKVFREDLEASFNGVTDINFLDIPNLFRIATAICRDVSDDDLNHLIKKLESHMLIVPAFSESDRLTPGHIEPMVREGIVAMVCNACSSQCKGEQEKFEIGEEQIGEELPFCYLCVPAKGEKYNIPDYYRVRYNIKCKECENGCEGHIFSIRFSECVSRNECLTAKVDGYL